ncbi:MAG: AraC family transcriptional regulator, partial [Clostridia bacterium]|nr:AraC family transcriptional regulator [Clostridia bacterium]
VIFPDEITFYEADGKEPWQYFWVGFSGENAGNLLEELGFSPAFPVFRFRDPRAVEELFDDMNRIDESTQEGQLCLTGNLYMLLSRIHPVSGAPAIRKNFGGKKEYVEQAIRYIQENYPTEVSVEDIARRLGINRSYFYTLFKEHTHTSPREFLITARISKLFKKHIGCSPTDYRKKHRG